MHFPHLYPTPHASILLLWGIVIHLVCDWFLQNDWMARNKANPYHPAAWVHAGIHIMGMMLLFPPYWAVALGTIHLAIDTRTGLQAWGRLFRQTRDPENPATMHVNFWRDQVAHILVLAFYAYLVGR